MRFAKRFVLFGGSAHTQAKTRKVLSQIERSRLHINATRRDGVGFIWCDEAGMLGRMMGNVGPANLPPCERLVGAARLG